MTIRNAKDFYSGLIFLALGLAFVIIARNYPMGSAVRMGPSYFPTMLGGLLALLGLIVTARGLFWGKSDGPIHSFAFRPLLLILGGVLAFALLIQPAGLILATLALIFIASMGGSDFKFVEAVVLYLVLLAVCVGVFVYGLGLPLRLLPE